MNTALKLYREARFQEDLPANSFLRIPRHKPSSSYPELCYPHEHPLKTGRKGKMYERGDFVSPICDSMSDMQQNTSNDTFGLSEYIAAKRRKLKKEDSKPLNAAAAAGGKLPIVHSWTCRGCGNHDRGSLQLGHEGYTCSCGVWAYGQIVGAHRQKLGAAESEDKTVTGDRPYEARTDKYDHGPETAKEAAAGRLARARTGGGLGGRRAGMHMGRLCDVQAITEREAAKSIVEAEVAAGIALTPRDRVKQRSVLSHLEELFTLLHPVDHEVKRAVRMAADSTYVSAVQHCHHCQRRDLCEVRLAERHAAAIAQAVFEHTIDQLCESECESSGARMDKQRLKDLRERMHRSSCFASRTSATQIASSKLMVSIINAPGFDFKKQCETAETDMPVMPSNFATLSGPPIVSSLNGCKRPATLRALVSPCLQRSTSICSNGESSPTPSKQIEWRNAISAIFVAHRTELAIAVRDSALRVIQTVAFQKAFESEPKVKVLDDNQLAFCLLNAVAMEQASADTASFCKSMRPNAGIADKIELGLLAADEAIGCIRAAMPADAASDKSEREADDLFH